MNRFASTGGVIGVSALFDALTNIIQHGRQIELQAQVSDDVGKTFRDVVPHRSQRLPLRRELLAQVQQIRDLGIFCVDLPRRRRDDHAPLRIAVDDRLDFTQLSRGRYGRAAEFSDFERRNSS